MSIIKNLSEILFKSDDTADLLEKELAQTQRLLDKAKEIDRKNIQEHLAMVSKLYSYLNSIEIAHLTLSRAIEQYKFKQGTDRWDSEVWISYVVLLGQLDIIYKGLAKLIGADPNMGHKDPLEEDPKDEGTTDNAPSMDIAIGKDGLHLQFPDGKMTKDFVDMLSQHMRRITPNEETMTFHADLDTCRVDIMNIMWNETIFTCIGLYTKVLSGQQNKREDSEKESNGTRFYVQCDAEKLLPRLKPRLRDYCSTIEAVPRCKGTMIEFRNIRERANENFILHLVTEVIEELEEEESTSTER